MQRDERQGPSRYCVQRAQADGTMRVLEEKAGEGADWKCFDRQVVAKGDNE